MTHLAAAVVAYSCQVAALVAAAWLALVLGRVRAPRLQLLHYEATLVAAVFLLPALASAGVFIAAPDAVVFSAPQVFVAAAAASADAHRTPLGRPWGIAGVVFVAGVVVRAAWLATGLLRLRRVRRAARELNSPPPAIANLEAALGVKARWFSTDALAVAATYGVRHPVVLLPPADLGRPDAALRAIAGHELRHVARRDWLRTMGEEAVRTALWFHPAVWFLVDRIRLCREQVVDAEVIAMTGDRRAYADALLESAATLADPPLAPAWLHARHLRARIVSIAAAGGPMSRTRFVSSAAALVVVLAAACTWSACAFPSHDKRDDAAGASSGAQTPSPGRSAESTPGATSSSTSLSAMVLASPDAPALPPPSASDIADARSLQSARAAGVTLPRVRSHTNPSYTPDAMKAKIQGDVVMDAVVAADGTVRAVRVTRSLDRGLDDEAVKAVRQWTFEPATRDGRAVPVTVAVVMNFRLR
jgi:TonB family protein